MQYERKSYRRFIEFLNISNDIMSILRLDKIPHYTTLNKFLIRIKSSILYKVIESFIINTRIRKIRASIDGTGFKDGNTSSYYTYRLNLRRHLKLSLIIDIDKQFVLALKVRRGPRHDNIDFKLLIDRIVKIKPLSLVIADKGYDSEYNHELVHRYNANSIIPVRRNAIKGKYRLDMKSSSHKETYPKHCVSNITIDN